MLESLGCNSHLGENCNSGMLVPGSACHAAQASPIPRLWPCSCSAGRPLRAVTRSIFGADWLLLSLGRSTLRIIPTEATGEFACCHSYRSARRIDRAKQTRTQNGC